MATILQFSRPCAALLRRRADLSAPPPVASFAEYILASTLSGRITDRLDARTMKMVQALPLFRWRRHAKDGVVPRQPVQAPAMSLLDTYLANAKEERQAAAATSLPNRRAMHERSAETWEELARGAELTAQRAAINLAAKSITGI